MRTVLRLVYTYFTATPVLRAFTFGGLALWAVSFYMLTTQAQSTAKVALAEIGMAAVFLGSSLMPLMVGSLARSHLMGILPYWRLKLLISAFLTVTLVSLLAGIMTSYSFGAGVSAGDSRWWSDPRLFEFVLQLGKVAFTMAFIVAGWLYLALWFVTSQRNMIGFAKGLGVIAFLLFVPVREVQDLNGEFSRHLLQIAIAWSVFGTGFLLWPKWQAFSVRWRRAAPAGAAGRSVRRIEGREVDLMLGTANPLMFIAAQAVPIIIAMRIGVHGSSVWLYYLTIFGAVAGAVAGQAAQRSRVLWLRTDWSRAELFRHVERSFWRHNGFVLGAIVLLTLAVGGYSGISTPVFAAGLPLLVLGTVLSTYLGLMVTRGLRWLEASVGVFVMLALMTLAIYVVEAKGSLWIVYVAEALMVVMTFVLREAARRRWTRIDWMECRTPREFAGRGAA